MNESKIKSTSKSKKQKVSAAVILLLLILALALALSPRSLHDVPAGLTHQHCGLINFDYAQAPLLHPGRSVRAWPGASEGFRALRRLANDSAVSDAPMKRDKIRIAAVQMKFRPTIGQNVGQIVERIHSVARAGA